MKNVIVAGKEYEVSKKGKTITAKTEGKRLTLSFGVNGVIHKDLKGNKVRIDVKLDTSHTQKNEYWVKEQYVKLNMSLLAMNKAKFINLSCVFTTPKDGELLRLVEIK